jgi:DNA-binding XRE family transcriptional regulator
MPYKTEKMKLSPNQDRRRKLSDKDKEKIRSMTNISQRKLAKMFKVSRRTIQFVQDPQKQKENMERRKERGGWRQYYDKDQHAKYVREHRRYKNKTLNK